MTPRPLDRRTFLQAVGMAGATAVVGASPRDEQDRIGAALRRPAPSWVDRPMRWAQLTLVEDDPGTFDPTFWLDYFARTRSDAVCLSAGGCVAYYPTQVPFHHRSAWLGDRDVFGELVAGCRKLGMVVIARTDPHATYDDVQAAHPDWIAVDAEGRPRRHWASPEMWVTCGLGPYNFEFMTEVKREIMSRYRVDAIFINRWDGSGTCYCEHCRTGLPGGVGPRPPAHRRPGRPGAAALSLLASAAALRPLADVGPGGARDQPRLVRDSEHRRRRHQPPRHGGDRRAWRRCSWPTARRVRASWRRGPSG